jgi:hypothetical protein
LGSGWLQLAKTDVLLLLDDWGMAALDAQTRADLREIIGERAATRRPSLPANCRSSTGMPGSATPRSSLG